MSSRRCCTICSVSGGEAAGASQETLSGQLSLPHFTASAETPATLGGFSKTFVIVTEVFAVFDRARTSVPRVTCVTLNLTVSSPSRRCSSASADRFSVRVPVKVALPAGIVTLLVPLKV